MSDVLFFAQIILILALALLAGSVVAGYDPLAAGKRGLYTIRVTLDRPVDHTAALGWTARTWFLARLAAGMVGATLATLIGSPVVIVGGFVAGFLGLGWYLHGAATKRKLEGERALIMVVRNLVELITSSNQTIDHALYDIASNCEPSLRVALMPLTNTEESIRARLVNVSRRFRSPVATRLCVDLLLSLESTPTAFIEQAREVLIPQLEDDLALQEKNYAAIVGGRTSGLIVAGLMLVTLFMVMHVGTLRAAYLTPVGQGVLFLVGFFVAGLVWLIEKITPRPAVLWWDLEEMTAQLERRYV